ncbi:MAG: CNNM domain-containing protein [Betaproteobacteria bacterium]|nr:CNNM domain-containing protein [Betaproteobacteria bacterium]
MPDTFLLIAFALICSGTLSMFETAILSSQRHRVMQMRASRRRGAATLLKILDDLDSVLATILLWNNFANVAIASLATLLAIEMLGASQASLSATNAVTTLVILLLAEITPKAIGVRYPERIACAAALILTPVIRISYPIIVVVRTLVRFMLSKAGAITETSDIRRLQVDELMALVSDQGSLKEIDDEHRNMLLRLIGMAQMAISELMVPRDRIHFLNLDDSDEQLQKRLKRTRHDQLLLCEGGLDKVIGVIRTIDAWQACAAGDRARLTENCRKPLYLPETLTPIDALREIIAQQDRLALIVDEFGGLIGMVKESDFIRHLTSSLLEHQPRTGADGNGNYWLVTSDEAISSINLRCALHLPTDESRTIGGLVAARLNQFPEYPLCLVVNDIRIEIEQIGESTSQIRIHNPTSSGS